MSEDRADSVAFRQFADELLASGIAFRFQARGRSMFPAIKDGEILQVEPVSVAGLKRGDIVLFRKGTEFKAHRIIRRSAGMFITRGDTGITEDAEVNADDVLGKVVAKECSETGKLILLAGAGPRFRFVVRELRRSLAEALRR